MSTFPRLRSVPALLAALCLLAPASALPYAVSLTNQSTGEVVRWFKADVPFWLHPSCSSDLPAATCLSECKASFQTWQGKSCSTLKMSYAGASSNLKLVAVGYNANGKNEVAWIENSAWSYGKYVLGVTSPYFYTSGNQTGHITEADIAMNGYLQTWSTSGKTWSTDVRNVLVHEIGHFFGLQHNLYPNANNPETMAPTADPYMKSQTPEADDIAGLCYLYPAAGKTACSSNDDCPYVVVDTSQGEKYGGVIPCQGGSCGGQTAQVPPGQKKKLGETCANTLDCIQPLYCQPLSGSQAVCSQDCSPAAKNCPTGFECLPFQNDPNKGACVKGGGPTPPSKDNGQPCQNSGECKSQLCVNEGNGQFCRQPCAGDAQCPNGLKCSLFAGKNYGACFADTGPPPATKGNGEPCQSSSECKSDLCVGSGAVGECIQACGGANACPAGYACMKLSSGAGGCFKAGDKKLDEPCESSSDCAGGICAASEGKYVCSQPCDSKQPCPTTYTCYPLTGGGGACFKTPAKAGDGQPCEYSSDCQSGLCVGSGAAKCSQPCTTGKDQCGPGHLCIPLAGGGGACIKLGNKTSGQPCNGSTECASGSCIGLGGAGFVCTQACAKTADCDCGFECTTFQGGDKLCTKGKKIACVANGAGCSSSGECNSGVCLAGTCAATCSIYTGSQTCPAGSGCVRLKPDKPEGACAGKGGVGFGGACKQDADCVGLFCHAGLCGKPCSPFLPNACTFGLVCNPANGEVGNCGAPAAQPDPGLTDANGGTDAGTIPQFDAGRAGTDDGGIIGQDAGGTGGVTTDPPAEDGSFMLCSSGRRGEPHSLAWPLLLSGLALIGVRRRRTPQRARASR